MSLRLKATAAVVLVLAGVLTAVWVLVMQGLDQASKWVTVFGFFVSTAVGVAGVAVGWLAYRQSRSTFGSAEPPQRVSAGGVAAVAVGGDSTGRISTEVTGGQPAASPVSSGGVEASGAGAVAIGGHNAASVRARVAGDDGDMWRANDRT